MKYSATILITLTTAFSAPYSHLAHASELNTIDVIGEGHGKPDAKRKTDQQQFYKSYSRDTIDAKTLQEEGTADVVDAIADVPGVSVNSYGAFNKGVSVRGLDGPRVGTVVDGVSIANQGMSHSGAGEINMTDLESVDSIDVIKGSPSVVYAPGASGGTVSVKTRRAPLEKGFGFKQKLGYDEGYGQTQSSTTLEGGTGRMGALIIYSRDKADDYKIGGDNKDKKILINNANRDRQVQTNALKVNDLGYQSEAITARAGVKLTDKVRLDLGWDNWLGKDMNLIHGESIGEAGIIQYERMERNRSTATLAAKQWGWLYDTELKLANQTLYQKGENSETELDSVTASFRSTLPLADWDIQFGGEAVFDQADTLVYSEQDYLGGYLNLEYNVSNWILSGGVRLNQWQTRQKLLDGTNPVVAEQLLGISGLTPEKTVTHPTWAIGAVYTLTPNQNLSVNLNTTFRNPDLYERYAYGSGFIGGGLDMEPEKGEHAELSWKYLDDKLSMTASVFYSRYENFISTKTIREITDYDGLQTCVQIGKCDPANNEYNNKESDFFRQYVKYYNSAEVTNLGAEWSARYQKNHHDVKVGVAVNEIRSDDLFVYANAQPLRLDASYKYQFKTDLQPWVKIKGEYVTNMPTVEQSGGFSPYFVTDFFAGFKAKDVTFNAGVRNLTNKVYRPPYNGINALARSYFANITYAWHSSK